jgi:F-type H+-transporting ATPase subunit O
MLGLARSTPLFARAAPSARTFAKKAAKAAAPAAASSDAAHQPLIKLYGIHARYANATYTAASKGGSLDKVETELLAISETAASNAAFKAFLSDPTMSRAAKAATCADLFGGKMSDITVNLMDALAGNARLAETSKVVGAYADLMKAKRGEVDAVITSAEPLSKADADQVVKALKTKVGAGKNVVLTMNVNPDILGGLQVQIGDQFVDLSAQSRIDTIGRAIGGI